ncbi:HAMP domain-containing histidine kinase [Falsigemmobacter intermedius]|uniref:histidine kinase n=2 Tax=Falsigemmobacter intermedius TaxID=1553448 RepID=A0A3S3V4F4_9RHOB|nr:ActS/PrrB/RegB family redox-sensitive histidine kinase [Falsigemmobacter intermedius]RWY45471.1 HAMP domain-containing histidine kinase [Falsigemmobacter intermedius]
MSMPHVQPDAEFLSGDSTWVRMQTVILVRWTAVAGQIGAIATVTLWFDLALPLFACAVTIGALVLSNLLTSTLLPANYRLSSKELRALLLFDLVQLAVLLALTGGTTNPFALLMVAPVAISATGLRRGSATTICIATLIASVCASVFSLPLVYTSGEMITIPPILSYGYLLGILITTIFIAVYTHRVSAEIRNMASALMATQMALSREQKLTDLGGVVAAYAHELGTPLATIKLVSAELMDELSDHENLNDLREDAKLIRDQADRCRDILHSMGRAGKDDLHLRQAPLDSVLREAAEPHMNRGRELIFDLRPADASQGKQPVIRRAAEVIHGLRNLIQNAVDFSASTVWIDGHWTDEHLIVRVIDDGPGYPAHLLGRIGDPFLRARPDEVKARPGYDGMGLGLFIAKTLLERSGAAITFRNGGDPFLDQHERPERSGAIVELIWPLAAISGTTSGGLGENRNNPDL